MALTSQPQKAGYPLTLEMTSSDLPKKSWIKISQIRTLSVERIGDIIGDATPEEMDLAVEGLIELIGS